VTLELSKAHEQLVRKLQAIYTLGADDVAAIGELPLRFREVTENTDLVREGDQPHECCLLVDGFVCRYKVLGQGQRQIFSFHIAGDIPDLQSLHIGTMDHSLGALTPCRVAYISHAAMTRLIRAQPNLAAAFWRDTLIDAAVFREWLAGVGRRSAYERIAHLVCEIFVRLRSVGLTDGLEFKLPITQGEIADSLGLTPVHVNRVLQQLRAEGLIATRGARWSVGDWERLQEVGDFDPAYLHLQASTRERIVPASLGRHA
jgi:CRP-like cAMP-binding protein